MTIELAAIEFSRRLTQRGIRHFIGGSVASSIWSEPRQTNDIDLVLDLHADNISAFMECASGDYQFDPVDWDRAQRGESEMPMLQVLHLPTMLKFDCYVANSDLERNEFRRAVHIEIGDATVPIASPEYAIIAKSRGFHLGNRISDRQWNDLLKLYDVRHESLDRSYIEHWLSAYGLLDIWEQIQAQSAD